MQFPSRLHQQRKFRCWRQRKIISLVPSWTLEVRILSPTLVCICLRSFKVGTKSEMILFVVMKLLGNQKLSPLVTIHKSFKNFLFEDIFYNEERTRNIFENLHKSCHMVAWSCLINLIQTWQTAAWCVYTHRGKISWRAVSTFVHGIQMALKDDAFL